MRSRSVRVCWHGCLDRDLRNTVRFKLATSVSLVVALELIVTTQRCGITPAMVVRPVASKVQVVVTDVDGTLMDSSHRLPLANRRALQRCLQHCVPVILATGKHRGPWVKELIASVASEGLQAASPWTLNAPGVFVQGLLVCDVGGTVVHRALLPTRLVDVCREVAERNHWTVLAYTDGDRIISNRADSLLARLRPLQEPEVEIDSVKDIAVHKMLFLSTAEEETSVRSKVAAVLQGEASITVAIPGLVEVLPCGASKADGVKVALGMLGLGASAALALGDGENDIELLELVRAAGGITAAVANARPALKAVAANVVASCDEAGWAQAVERWAIPKRE